MGRRLCRQTAQKTVKNFVNFAEKNVKKSLQSGKTYGMISKLWHDSCEA